MGTRGPVPKPLDKKLGHGAQSADREAEITRAPNEPDRLLGPEPPEWLDGYAREIYESVRRSGQAIYYTSSDWTVLGLVCRGAMEFVRKPSAMMLGSVLSGFTDLAMTEGSRRRIKIELGTSAAAADPEADEADEITEDWYKRLKKKNEEARANGGIFEYDDPDIAQV